MDRLEAIKVFAEVARLNSFSAAARSLGQSLATVSRKVTLLEEYLKVQLLTRTTRAVNLTKSGETYLNGVWPLLESLEQIESEVTEADQALRGSLTITTPGPFGRKHIVNLIAEFQELNPEISVRHIFDNSRLDYVASGIDLGLRIGPLRDSSLRLLRLGEVRAMVCASASYLERHGIPTLPEDLKQHRTVAFGPLSERILWNFGDSRNREFTLEVEPAYRVDSIDAIVRYVLEGGGIGFFYSYQVAEHIAAGRLRRILADYEMDLRPVSFLYPDTAHLPARVASFINFSAPRLRSTLIQIERSIHLEAT